LYFSKKNKGTNEETRKTERQEIRDRKNRRISLPMSRVARKQKKNLIQDIAAQRMSRLFELAKSEYAKHPDRSERYVQLIRNISMRNRMSIPREIKRSICKHCYAFLVPGNNASYRLKEGYIVISCQRCGKKMRYPYKGLK
jgi:ribonuclease P protein subunit RPR2